MTKCKGGYEVEIIYFRSYGGDKNLQIKWEKHIELRECGLINQKYKT